MSLLNCSIVEIQITPSKMDKRFYKVPTNLLDIFLSENIKDEQNLNIHLSEFSELILFNDDILNIRREEIDLRRKAFLNDGTVKIDEDFQTEKHKTIFSFKNMNKLNSFRINPKNRYSNNPAINKSIGTGINFYSGDSHAGICFCGISDCEGQCGFPDEKYHTDCPDDCFCHFLFLPAFHHIGSFPE